MDNIFILFKSILCPSFVTSESTTYIVCKGRNEVYPYLVGTNWQVRIRSDKEVMEQTNVRHGLTELDMAKLNAETPQKVLTKMPGVVRQLTPSHGRGELGDL